MGNYAQAVRRLLIALSILSYVNGRSQNITGVIKDDNGQEIENATVALLNKDSSLLKYEISDKTGRYTFVRPGQGFFIVKVSYAGYPTMFSGIFSLKGNDMDITVPEIVLHKPIQELQNVTVSVGKSLLERKFDRLVFNLENSLAAQGMSLVDALSMTPMINISERNISMVGKGELRVMINERIVHLKGADLVAYLRTLRSDEVAKIEIITNPSSKYSAEGNSGMINIVLKKNNQLGWRGSLSTTFLQNKRSTFMNSATLNYQSNRISSSLRLRQIYKHGIIGESNDLMGNDNQILNSYPRATSLQNVGGNFSLDYKINNRNNLGFVYDLNDTKSTTNMDAVTVYQTKFITDSTLFTESNAKSTTISHTLNVYHDFRLDTLGKVVNSSFNYFSNQPETNSDLFTTANSSTERNSNKNRRYNRYDVWSLQTDVTLPYKWAKIDFGGTYILFRNNADVGFYNWINGDFRLDVTKSNRYNYKEENLAGYFNIEKRVSEKWTAKAGLRYEHSFIDGLSLPIQIKTKYDYGKLFPTAYVGYKANKLNTFSLTYSRRITRPSLNQINPFKFYITPHNYLSGNPDIKPSCAHNIELSYLYRSLFSVSIFGQKTVDDIGTLVKVKDNITGSIPENYLEQNSLGIYATINYRISKWWENTSFATFSYSMPTSSVPEIVVKNGSTFNYGTNNTFIVNKWLRYFLGFSNTPGSTNGNMHTFGRYNLNCGLRGMFLENRLTVAASFFKGSQDKYRIYYNDFIGTIKTDYNYQTFNLTGTLMFGKSKVKGNTKRIDFSGSQRADN